MSAPPVEPHERRLRNWLHAKGLSTTPTTDPADLDTEPEPEGPRPRRRLPNWRKGEVFTFGRREDEEPVVDDVDDEDQAAEEDEEDTEDAVDEGDDEQPVKTHPRPRGTRPAPLGRARKVGGIGRTTAIRSRRIRSLAGDRRMRIIAFNGTAAAIGYSGGLAGLLGTFLPAADHAAQGMFSLVLAAAAAYGAWKFTGQRAVLAVLPQPWVSRVLLTAGAAEVGRRLAPQPVAWLNQHGTTWGLGPSAVSLLITAGAMTGGLWWLLDHPARRWHWAARWLVRIPLASAILATALYAPGPTL